MNLCKLLKSSTLRAPSSIALIHGARRITYEMLWDSVQAAASRLLSDGLAEGGRVALLMENSPEYVVYYYGTLAAGGIVVPLNTAARARDLIYQLNHCRATHLITDGLNGEAPEVSQAMPRLKMVDALDPLPRSEHGFEGRSFEDPAAIIYTSGTTGKPKGVTLSNGNLVRNVESILAYLALTSDDVIVNVLPFYYSYGNSVLHTHLAAGAKVILGRSLVYPQVLLETMELEKATGFSGVPSSFGVLLARGHLEKHRFTSLRYVTQAGGAMPIAAIERVRGFWPESRFFVMYGQTEATARLTYLPPEWLDRKMGSVGVPIPGVEITIRNENGSVVPCGETGEIWASGDNIMLGYWNDIEGTKRVLESGWLRTGDLAHQDGDGYIYIDGRKSEMIKSGAHRISPAEIESVLAELVAVEEAAVTGVPDDLLGQVIKAVIVPRAGGSLDQVTVQRHCRERLPAYKVPRFVEFSTALPRTGSGKIQRYLLAEASAREGRQ